jgi:hypothetical protein
MAITKAYVRYIRYAVALLRAEECKKRVLFQEVTICDGASHAREYMAKEKDRISGCHYCPERVTDFRAQ